jgi:hypothetical protein
MTMTEFAATVRGRSRPRKNPIETTSAPSGVSKPIHFHISISDTDGCHLDADTLSVIDGRLVAQRDGQVIGIFAKWEYAFELSHEMLESREELPGEAVPPVDAAPAVTQ